MGFFDKVISKKTDDENIEEILNNMDVTEESMYDDADALVKPIALENDSDVQVVATEIKAGNIVLLNVGAMVKRNKSKLKELVGRIKEEALKIDGDIVGISEDRILVTPSKVKVVRKKSAD